MKKKPTPPKKKKKVNKTNKKSTKKKPAPYGDKRHKGPREPKPKEDDGDVFLDYDFLGDQPEF